MALPPAYKGIRSKEGGWGGKGDREMGSRADGLLGWGLVGTAGSQGCLDAAAGPEIPRGQRGMCWHLVSAKRVRRPECSISLGTGLEQRGPGVHACAHAGDGGVGGCELNNPELSALVLWLVNGKQPFRINIFSK